jgi:hypothetical protein
MRVQTLTEAVEGFSAGDRVLVQGERTVKAGDRVRVIEEALPTVHPSSTSNAEAMRRSE